MTSYVPQMTTPAASSRARVPLPALGAVVALVWVFFRVIQPFIGYIAVGSNMLPYLFAYMGGPLLTAAGTAVMWAFILQTQRIPKVSRLRALPFAIPAVLCGAFLMVSEVFDASRLLWWGLLRAVTLTLWALAWIRLRGRPALALLAVLFTLVFTPVLEFAMTALTTQAWWSDLWWSINGLWRGPLQEISPYSIFMDLVFLVPLVVAVLIASFAAPVGSTQPRAERPDAPRPAGIPSAGSFAPTNGMAIASLVLGVVGMSLLAVIFGHVSRNTIRRTGEAGDGMAVAGLVLEYIGLSVSALAIVWLGVVYLQLLQ